MKTKKLVKEIKETKETIKETNEIRPTAEKPKLAKPKKDIPTRGDEIASKAIARFIRVSPRKARQVIDLIRGKDVLYALSILSNLNRRPTKYIKEVLKSAIDNAKFKFENKIDENKLYISKMWADGGPMMKRFKAQAMGRATMIRRRTSHIGVELKLKNL